MSDSNNLLLRAARGEEVDRPPVWLMRQAGRILPQYRALREKGVGFKELVTTPELACRVTLQPVDELGVDAAIIFSDILEVAEAMGLSYEMVKGKGPVFESPLRSKKQINTLQRANPEQDLRYVAEAIRLVKKELKGRVPLIGFAGAPWTLLAFMIEGESSKKKSFARRFLYQQPEAAHQALELITDSTIRYLKMQAAAGADILQVFDSFAGLLSPDLFDRFLYPYLEKIARHITDTPLIIFPKGAYFALSKLKKLPAPVLGLDWNVDPALARQQIGTNMTLQGNMDPCLLYADTDYIQQATREMIEAFGKQNYIANLGHGVYPDTPLDGVKCFVDTVKGSQ